MGLRVVSSGAVIRDFSEYFGKWHLLSVWEFVIDKKVILGKFIYVLIALKAYRLSELNFLFILKVANIRCFILIAVEIFHNIICKQPRTKEICHCLIFLHPVKNSMLIRVIFIRPDSELIRESFCACAELFIDEENVLKSNRGRSKTLMDSTRKLHKKEDSASFV